MTLKLKKQVSLNDCRVASFSKIKGPLLEPMDVKDAWCNFLWKNDDEWFNGNGGFISPWACLPRYVYGTTFSVGNNGNGQSTTDYKKVDFLSKAGLQTVGTNRVLVTFDNLPNHHDGFVGPYPCGWDHENFSLVETIEWMDPSFKRDSLQNRLRNSISTSIPNVSVDVIEGPELIGLVRLLLELTTHILSARKILRNPLKMGPWLVELATILSSARTVKERKLRAKMSKILTFELAAINSTLIWLYAIKPLLALWEDIQKMDNLEISNALKGGLCVAEVTHKVNSNELYGAPPVLKKQNIGVYKYSHDDHGDLEEDVYVDAYAMYTGFVKVKLVFKIENVAKWLINSVGFAQPALIAWQIVPLSFIVDRVIDVSGILAPHRIIDHGIEIIDRCTSIGLRGVVSNDPDIAYELFGLNLKCLPEKPEPGAIPAIRPFVCLDNSGYITDPWGSPPTPETTSYLTWSRSREYPTGTGWISRRLNDLIKDDQYQEHLDTWFVYVNGFQRYADVPDYEHIIEYHGLDDEVALQATALIASQKLLNTLFNKKY